MSITFFFDVASPYSYLASSQIDRIEEETGFRVIWRPMLLGGVFKATGNQSPVTVAARAKHLRVDLQDWARLYGVPLTFPPHFPPNSLTAMRVIAALDSDTKQVQMQHLAKILFHSYWAEGGDIADPQQLSKTLERHGIDASLVLAARGEQAVKDRLKATTHDAIERGVFGAPSFFVAGRMFFGNDRIEMMIRYCQALPTA